MPFPSLDAALHAGAVIVTPNNRLARQAVMRHDTAQRRAGRTTWPAARALPWRAFVAALWTEAIAQGADAVPIAPSASLHAWQSIIAAEDDGLLDARGAARSAAEAYEWFHAYRNAGESLRAWQASGMADDVAAFARWAKRYDERLQRRGRVDSAELPDRLICYRGVWPADLPIAVLGFAQVTPQQQRLLDALAAHGADVCMLPPPARAAACARVSCASPTEELARALQFARERAQQAPGARIGIVVQDLASRRSETLALADEILAPSRLVPLAPHATPPYGISLGAPLADVPIVAVALDLLALASVGLDATEASALLRSPYLPGAPDAWHKRAYVERTWRDQGRRRVRANDVASTLERIDADLAQRLRAPLPRRAAAPRDWVSTWSAWLDTFGWPGARPLDSAEWQARDAWQAVLMEFAALDDVVTALDAAAAFDALRALTRERVWAPQSGDAPIQILGVLEASGLTFEALWLAGFTADAWPPPASHNPFLPLAWQRAHDTPRASAASQLAYARALSAGFAHAAAHVIVSHAREINEAPQAVSPLFEHWPELTHPDDTTRLRDRIAAAGVRPVPWRDDTGPPLQLTAEAGGGTAVIESQSACPFQAFARHRLNARAWEEPDEGLTPKERGTLLHFAMRAFWDDVRDHATLVALDAAALEARVTTAVVAARGKLPTPRWRALAPAIAAGETQRLTQTILAWLTLYERPRPPFRVLLTERDAPLTLGGVRLRLKIDRADTLEPGDVAVIDYKSGRVTAPGAWFRARPEGTQLGLYVVALKAAVPTRPVSAAAYAQIKAGQIKVSGVVKERDLWEDLTPPAKAMKEARAWRDLEAFWMETLTALGEEFQRGEAGVMPRNAQACQRCDLQALCRIRNLYDDAVREPVVTDEDE